MAATTKDALLAVTHKEFQKLDKLLDEIDDKHAVTKSPDDTSIKDVVGHRAHWIALFLGWYADGQSGKAVHFPAEGYKWNQLKEYNKKLRHDQQNLSWNDACLLLRENNKKLVQFIENLSQDALYSDKMKGAKNNWTTGRWAEAAGPSHYRSAVKYIRKCLKDLT